MFLIDIKLRLHAGKYIPTLVYPDGSEYEIVPGVVSEDAGKVAHELRRWRKAWSDSRLRRIYDLAVGKFDDTDELLRAISVITRSSIDANPTD